VCLEVREKAIRYGLNEEHSEVFSRAWIQNPADCLGVLPGDVVQKVDRALATVTRM
jgi:hypothetical protein